jgi:hypothetical protein
VASGSAGLSSDSELHLRSPGKPPSGSDLVENGQKRLSAVNPRRPGLMPCIKGKHENSSQTRLDRAARSNPVKASHRSAGVSGNPLILADCNAPQAAMTAP